MRASGLPRHFGSGLLGAQKLGCPGEAEGRHQLAPGVKEECAEAASPKGGSPARRPLQTLWEELVQEEGAGPPRVPGSGWATVERDSRQHLAQAAPLWAALPQGRAPWKKPFFSSLKKNVWEGAHPPQCLVVTPGSALQAHP